MQTHNAEVIPFRHPAEPLSIPDPFPAESPLYFPVSSRAVSVADASGDAKPAAAFQAIVREDTGAVLGIHGQKYKLVANEPLYRGFDNALRRSGIDLREMIVTDHVNYGGRRVIRDYQFPTVTTEPRVGDIVQLKVSVINSFDSVNAFTAQVGGLRLWCLNGAVSLHGASSVYGRHTSGFDTARALEKINRALEQYMLNAYSWSEWAGRDINDTVVSTAFEAFPDVNNTMLQRLQTAWETESGHAGNTVWALYNALTRWSTHAPIRESSEGNRASIVLDRERRVRKFMRSQAFTKLAA